MTFNLDKLINEHCPQVNKYVLLKFVISWDIPGEGVGFQLDTLLAMWFAPLYLLTISGKPVKLNVTPVSGGQVNGRPQHRAMTHKIHH